MLQVYRCTIKFRSVHFSSSWSSMLVVIHKNSLVRRRLCGKLHGQPSQLFALAVIDRWEYIGRNDDLCLLHLHLRPQLWGSSRRNIAMAFDTEKKLEWFGYPRVKKIEDTFIRFDRIHLCNGQTDRQTYIQTDTA